MTSRRELLGALAGLGLVPLLPSAARGQTAPRRLVVFYTPNGTVGPQWRPKGTETAFTLGRILTPLEPHRAKLLVLGGLNMALADAGFGSHHTRGIGGLLTGRAILMGNFKSAGPATAGWAAGISLDQHVAKVVGATTRFRSLELGVRVMDAEVRGRVSYLGPNQPVPPIESPYDAFDRLFAGMKPMAGDGGLDKVRAERKSVLDFVQQELMAVRRGIGTEDRPRLDAHIESVRDIERRLAPAQAPPVAGCAAPAQGGRMDLNTVENMPAIGRLQMDLLVGALACDHTRVATLQWTSAESNQTFPWLGINGQHHVISHAGDNDAGALENLTRINTWYAEQLAYLLTRLSAVREGDRTLLDNTVVLWMNEVGKGNNHAHRDLPFLLAGSCGGQLRTGRFVDFMAAGAPGRPHNDLLITLANLMGLPEKTFGDPSHCTGPLPGLT